MEKKLGKIQEVKFGLGSYQGAMLGLHVTLGDGSWGVTSEVSTWDPETIECSKYAKWTEEGRSKIFDEIMRYISKLLNEAKVNSINELKGIPIEATFDNNTLKEWRILKEVL